MREPGITTKLARRFAWSAVLLFAIAPQAAEGLELEWLSHQGGTVYSTNLRPGSAELPTTVIATTGYQGLTWGNVLSEAGHLYSVGWRHALNGPVWELLDIDLETGTYSQTPISLPVRNLTLDSQGRLWTTHSGTLYRLEIGREPHC